MSYATVAAENAPPISKQPQPDPALLQTQKPNAPTVLDDSGPKVNVVHPSYKEHPMTTASVNHPNYEEDRENFRAKAKKDIHHAEERGFQLWDNVKERLLRPGVAGGLMGIVNVGLLGTLGYRLYNESDLRSDKQFLGWSAAGTLVVLGAEGLFAEVYRNTDQGRAEERRAREEGTALYKHAKEVVLRPQVFRGLMGTMNLGIIGCVSYIAYDNWGQPYWDRKTVAAITTALLALVVGEGVVAEQYKAKEYPKRK